MSGRDEVTWSKEPPSEPGYYWFKLNPHVSDYCQPCEVDEDGARFISDLPNCDLDFEFIAEHRCLFGPRILSPLELTAAAKRVEELEGVLRELTKSMECYSATRKPVDEWDEYDSMMFPIWQRATAYLDSLPGDDNSQG